MYVDNLTWAAIAVIVVTLLATMWASHRANIAHREDLRKIAGNYVLILSSEEGIKLCKAIHKLHPDACPGLDYSLQVSSNGDTKINEWNYSQSEPTQEQLMDAIRTLDS